MTARALLPAAAILAALLLSTACSGGPPAAIAEGEVLAHRDAGFRLILPEGWQAHASARGLSLVRRAAYEGGYPTLNVRRLEPEEAAHYVLEGKRAKTSAGAVEYRYQDWRNSLGRGVRLEALVTAPNGVVFFVDASIWDSAIRRNERFFDEQFWPIVNSIRVGSGS